MGIIVTEKAIIYSDRCISVHGARGLAGYDVAFTRRRS